MSNSSRGPHFSLWSRNATADPKFALWILPNSCNGPPLFLVWPKSPFLIPVSLVDPTRVFLVDPISFVGFHFPLWIPNCIADSPAPYLDPQILSWVLDSPDCFLGIPTSPCGSSVSFVEHQSSSGPLVFLAEFQFPLTRPLRITRFLL